MKTELNALVFFDGVCNFCNSSVNFIILRDPKGYFKFAPLQGETAKEKLGHLKQEMPDSIVLVESGKIYYHSTAALRIARKLTFPWPAFYLFMLVPAFIRNSIYRWIAKNRYRWFGKKDSCMIPSADQRKRFFS